MTFVNKAKRKLSSNKIVTHSNLAMYFFQFKMLYPNFDSLWDIFPVVGDSLYMLFFFNSID